LGRFNSKAKGGGYERVIIAKLAKAFVQLGVAEDDIFRTKNSGSTKAQPGDIQFSPKMAKLFPVLIECKHYKNILYKLGKNFSSQPKSYPTVQWWKQVIREQALRQDKFGILVFRQNNCQDLVCIQVKHYQALFGSLPKWEQYTWSQFTFWKKDSLVILPFKEFIKVYVQIKLKQRIAHTRSKNAR